MDPIIKIAEGAYFVPSFSEQTVIRYTLGVTTRTLVSTMEKVEEPPTFVGVFEPDLAGYGQEARERIARGLMQRGTVELGSFKKYIDSE